MIGERIREIRKAKDVTQQEFADSLSVKRNTVATWEGGRSVPQDSAISLICRTYKVNEMWLKTGDGEMCQPVSIEEELASIFGPAMSGDMSSRSRMIRAFAKLPEQYYPILEEAILEYARKLSQEKGE